MEEIRYDMAVVLYHPEEEELCKIKDYAENHVFENIYIYDNSPYPLPDSSIISGCSYNFMGENSGLSKPYNLAIKEALQNGANFLLLLDQDSVFPIFEIDKIKQFLCSHRGELEEVAVVCPMIVTDYNRDKVEKAGVSEIKWTINSGSFLKLDTIEANRLRYDENVFLDGVDYDFCYGIIKSGCKILRVNDSQLFQTFGYKSDDLSSFTKHSARRYYNIAHNRKYIFWKYWGWKGLVIGQAINLRLIFRILLNEDEKVKKALACMEGIIN